MSQQPPSPDLPEGLGPPPLPRGDESPVGNGSRRAASVTLRRQADGGVDDDVASMMDPATKSLADALAITYRILIIVIIVLGVIFLFSGVRKVNEFESGIKLTFGEKKQTDIRPGVVFTWPEPVGELVRVQTGPRRFELKNDFFPSLTDQENSTLAKEGVQSLAQGGSDSLDPSEDGHLLTADGNIAHTRWSVSYIRENAAEWAETINPANEQAIVQNIVRRAVVEAVSNVTMDELLRSDTGQTTAGSAAAPGGTSAAPAPAGAQPTGEAAGEATDENAEAPAAGDAAPAAAAATPSAGGSGAGAASGLRSKVERMAEESAQRELNKIDAGIRIDRLTLTVKIPPRRVMGKYNEVLSAQSKASTEIEKARKDASQTLIEAAGEAAPVLLELIDRYERLLAEKPDQAEATLSRINDVLLNQPIEIDGTRIEGKTFGEATTTIEQAREYRSRVVNEVGRDVSIYNTKYEVYQASPLVAITTEWTDAYKAFLTREDVVQSMFVPEATKRLTLLLNRDPGIAKEQERKRNEAEAKAAFERSQEAQKKARYSAGGG